MMLSVAAYIVTGRVALIAWIAPIYTPCTLHGVAPMYTSFGGE